MLWYRRSIDSGFVSVIPAISPTRYSSRHFGIVCLNSIELGGSDSNGEKTINLKLRLTPRMTPRTCIDVYVTVANDGKTSILLGR